MDYISSPPQKPAHIRLVSEPSLNPLGGVEISAASSTRLDYHFDYTRGDYPRPPP